jgi:hypothetical protein
VSLENIEHHSRASDVHYLAGCCAHAAFHRTWRDAERAHVAGYRRRSPVGGRFRSDREAALFVIVHVSCVCILFRQLLGQFSLERRLGVKKLPRHSHPTSRASIAGAVLGIIFIASAVMVAVPVAMNWPAWWPGALAVIALCCFGVALIVRHMSSHREDRTHA